MRTSSSRGPRLKSPSRPFLFLTLIPVDGGGKMARRRAAHAMAYVTAPDRATAQDIAREVVDRRLAACANLWPVESVYRWHGKREESNEFVIVLKTRAALLPKLIAEVRRLHPSEVPC
ncbi:MAG: divalent-cation tolerance protein CutA, partial [Methanobacteriota archaeon]